MLQNIKDWKTTLIGILALVAVLPQSDIVQNVASISPKAATYITLVGGIAAGFISIFGVSTKKNS